MRVKPIIFNTQMVQAILSGEKHCTRRTIQNHFLAVHITSHTPK